MTMTMTDLPTFIDLRSFAAGAEFSADPFGAGRHLLPLRDAPVEVGAIALAAGAGTSAALAGDWWLVAAEGTVTLNAAGVDTLLTGEHSCVVPDGTAFSWKSDSGARLIYLRYCRGAGSAAEITAIDPKVALAPSGTPLAELLIGPTPSCRNHTTYRSTDGDFTCGIWDSTPYHRKAMRYAHFELMVLLEGCVTFVDEVGRTATFGKTDIFLVEQGASCSWESRTDVSKIYAIFRPLS